MGFSNMMSLVGGGGAPAVSDPSMEHGGGIAEPQHEHGNMNFGDKLLGMAESRVPFSQAFFPQGQQGGMTPPPPGQSMPELPDLISMNAKPQSGGGVKSAILKLLMGA